MQQYDSIEPAFRASSHRTEGTTLPAGASLNDTLPAIPELDAAFKAAMRSVASAVTLVTSRDRHGLPHGMAASAVISVSMDPPSFLVAVNRTAGIHPVLMASQRMCVNYLADEQRHLLEPFSRSDLRPQRFASADWRNVIDAIDGRLPWLPQARAAVFGDIDRAVEYGTHTLFIARVTDVALPNRDQQPLIWVAGRCESLARRA
jgi:flavin reductase (DIM6/NTAB) family NADH-FMN oxidoreductase RutF